MNNRTLTLTLDYKIAETASNVARVNQALREFSHFTAMQNLCGGLEKQGRQQMPCGVYIMWKMDS